MAAKVPSRAAVTLRCAARVPSVAQTGGFLYGNYLATHNSLRAPGAADGARLHYGDADIRRKHRATRKAPTPKQERPRSPSPRAPPPPAPPPPPEAPPAAQPAAVPPPPPPQLYGWLPPYDPSAYAPPPPHAPFAPPYGYGHGYGLLPAQIPSPAFMPPPGARGFEPDSLGARLNPRKFKHVPLAVLHSIPPAGMRSVRRDNM